MSDSASSSDAPKRGYFYTAEDNRMIAEVIAKYLPKDGKTTREFFELCQIEISEKLGRPLSITAAEAKVRAVMMRPRRSGKGVRRTHWTDEQDDALIGFVNKGLTGIQIMRKMQSVRPGITVSGVRSRASELGVELQSPMSVARRRNANQIVASASPLNGQPVAPVMQADPEIIKEGQSTAMVLRREPTMRFALLRDDDSIRQTITVSADLGARLRAEMEADEDRLRNLR